jgi:hypothetical protein
MELKEQAPATTLARTLGDTAQVSGLAIRLSRLSGAGERLPEWLLKVAVERVEPVLLHIAAACARVDETMEPWATLRHRLHPRRTVRTDALPHWTRFAILPGLTRDGYAPPQWLMRRE